MELKKNKVLIAMSGGVDSSVAAALLKDQGFDCVGAFFVTWTEQLAGLQLCPWEQDAFDARRVCDRLGIPLRTFNFEAEYRARVIEYFFREYEQGRTPNPDVRCNREIKFNLFLQKAKQLDADFIATGHYAQIKKQGDTYQLRKAKDAHKDQSYFLYTLTQPQLRQTLFPIGGLTKPRVRQLAKKYRLPNWDKKDSQGICFLGAVKLRDFLQTRIPIKWGNIVDTAGKIVGEHEGTAFYTIGQRQGLKIGGAGQPYYVVAKNHQTNTIIVSRADSEALLASTLEAGDLTWVHEMPKLPLRCHAKIRYRQPDQRVTVSRGGDGTLTVNFAKPQRAATVGQSVVFYRGKQVLGGGVVERVTP